MVKQWLTRAAEEHDVFLFLLGYRWLSLLPPLVALVVSPSQELARLVFLGACADNLLLTLLHPRVNRLVLRAPVVFGIDLIVVATFVGLTGGISSPYYLYALSPLLAAAFFFQMRGALTTASAFTLVYAVALGWSGAVIDVIHLLTQISSFFLIAILFGYSSILVERIRRDRALLAQSNATLERTNRELESIHNLALTMQSSATDVADVQEIILTTITNAMGFERAMLGTVDQERNTLIGWLIHCQREGSQSPTGLFHTTEIPLQPEYGVIAQTVLRQTSAYVADTLPPTTDLAVNQRLKLSQYAILPLFMRDHPVGVLIVDNPDTHAPISPESMRSLEAVANQAAIALGSTKLCIERAQKLAVEEERNRIAMDIHDTATQSLFGIVYTLDGCTKMLPAQPAQVQAKLIDLSVVATRTLNDLRRSVYDIWGGDLTEAEFRSELSTYLQKLSAPAALLVEIQVKGDFNRLAGIVRKNVLRIAEEGIANVVKHSRATHATITLDLTDRPHKLIIEDNGCGFDSPEPTQPLKGFGMMSIRERARAIGAEVQLGDCDGAGARLEVILANDVPAVWEADLHADPACR
jgi:signal transduction histidine kinase